MAVVDLQIEQSVANLQVVIELGRVIRDRKVLPVKVGGLSVCLCVVQHLLHTHYKSFISLPLLISLYHHS